MVTALEIEPEEMKAEAPERPHRVEYGDAFALRWYPFWGMPSPNKLIIDWHYEDSPEATQRTERNL